MTTTQVQPEAPMTGPMTYEQIREMFQDIGRSQKETDRIIKEIGLKQEETARSQAETARSQEETARQMKETDRKMEETDRQISNVTKQLGGMANSDGDAAEELFATSLESKMMFAGQHFDGIDFKVKRKAGGLRGEFDIVLYNCTAVGIVEVKNKACKDDLESMVTKKVPLFRTLFPQYRDHAIYLGIGSMSFDDRVIKRAHELGIGILRQKGDTIEVDTGNVRAY
ncbi:hypothetical protein FACS1894137_02500 [Spirochaetia bacterium]|nr:hypothetical protein FACS1894137_02500 [Spirochaetia bacterium]